MNKKKDKKGFTTGTSATAAAQAAASLLYGGEDAKYVDVKLPGGTEIRLEYETVEKSLESVTCSVNKYSGDDPDVTNGIQIWAKVEKSVGKKILLKGGNGVGKVTRRGLQIPPGEDAINPIPRAQIIAAVKRTIPDGEGVIVTIIVPQGEEVAKKTMNFDLGIVGGISILGTTGIVEPMSDEAYKNSLTPQVSLAISHHNSLPVVLTPGKMGKNFALSLGIPVERIIICSNYVGVLLQECVDNGLKEILLLGHHGKFLKLAAGIFQTHSKIADGRKEIITAHAALAGVESDVLQELMTIPTAEESFEVLESLGYAYIYQNLAKEASNRAQAYLYNEAQVGSIFYNMQKRIIAACPKGERLLEELKCLGK